MAEGSPTVQRRRIGMELRRLREAAGIDREVAADHVGLHPGSIQRFEAGRGGIKAPMVTALLDCYGVDKDDPIREELTQMARAGRTRSWWSIYTSSIDSGYATYIGFEDGATELLTYAALIVPGLLQTEAYANAVIRTASPEMPDEKVQQRVKIRLQRQKRLESGLSFWAVLDEAVIRRTVGGPDVMRAQLEHLAEMSRLPSVQVQVLPFAAGAYPGMLGSFTIMNFEHDPCVVYLEGATSDQFLEGDAAEPYTVHYNGLRAAGLHPDESRRLIEDAARALR